MRGAIVGACVWLCAAPAFAQPPTARAYDDLVRQYRAGSFERAMSELRFISVERQFDEVPPLLLIGQTALQLRASRIAHIGRAYKCGTKSLLPSSKRFEESPGRPDTR